jgi:hypothetical protein
LTLKGQYIKTIEWGIIHLSKKNNLQSLFFRNLGKIGSLRIWRMRLMAKKVMKLSISRLIFKQQEKILDPLFSH